MLVGRTAVFVGRIGGADVLVGRTTVFVGRTGIGVFTTACAVEVGIKGDMVVMPGAFVRGVRVSKK